MLHRVSSALLIAAVLLGPASAHAADKWTRLTSANFELDTTAGEKQGQETIQRFEQVREFFRQASPIRSTSDLPLRIIQFNTAAQYARVHENNFAVSYFVTSPAREYIVLGDRATKDFGLAIHEYMHLVVRNSGLKLPTWLNEGWADVFSTLRPMGKETAVGDLLPDRMKALAEEKWLDFDTLAAVGIHSSVYNEGSRIGIFYAESWALAHMLFLSPEYKENFGKFVIALNRGESSQEACQSAFGRSSAAVFQDLRRYFERKNLVGAIYETHVGKQDGRIASRALSEFDARLGLADLLVARGKGPEANVEYEKLEQEQPESAELLLSRGDFALWGGDRATARKYYQRAFDGGNADARMCYQLAMLEREAKTPVAKVIPMVERALQSRPEFIEAKVQLGLMKVEVRDFAVAATMLHAIPTIKPAIASSVFCTMALADIQSGDAGGAEQSMESCRQWSKTEAEILRAEKIGKFVAARAKASVGVRPGEKLQRAVGSTAGVACSAEGSRLLVVVGGKQTAFDLPAPDAVEFPANPRAKITFNCGPMQPVAIGVEFASPLSAVATSSGIVRRLDY